MIDEKRGEMDDLDAELKEAKEIAAREAALGLQEQQQRRQQMVIALVGLIHQQALVTMLMAI